MYGMYVSRTYGNRSLDVDNTPMPSILSFLFLGSAILSLPEMDP